MAGQRADEAVVVAVRCRPLGEQEAREGRRAVVQVDPAARQVLLTRTGGGTTASEPVERAFTFDAAFGPDASQKQVYDATARGIVDSVLEGFNGTVFAYGQTGTGKTHTMEGGAGEAAGIVPRAFDHLFGAIGGAGGDLTFLVRASMLEIYNEDIRDLLAKDPSAKLDLHEGKDGAVYVKGLKSFVVKSAAECISILEAGKRNRTVGATLMNQDSSRSHCVLTVTVEAAKTSAEAAGAPGSIRVGKLSLVDLAGSERQSKTGAAGDRLREAAKINLSLSALGNVISALVDGKSGHIPYRDSKLTRLLQDSLGGNTRTVMIANVGPADYNYDETLSTLRYANRAKNIQNKPRINEDPKDAMLREFQAEIARLRAQLDSASPGSALPSSATSSSSGVAQAPTAEPQDLPPEEVKRMRHQLEAELRAEWSASSGAGPSPDLLAGMQREVEMQLAVQVKRVAAERARLANQAAKLERSLRAQSAHVQVASAQREQVQARNSELASKLRMLESKLLRGEQRGGLDVLARDREAEVKRAEAELRRQQAAKAEKDKRIAELEAGAQQVEARYASLQEQADATSAALAAGWQEYQAARQAGTDTYEQFQRDREDLVETIRSLHHNLALKSLVMDAFIPQDEVSKLLRRARYDEAAEKWVLEPLKSDAAGSGSASPKRPPSAALFGRRPTSSTLRLQLDQLVL